MQRLSSQAFCCMADFQADHPIEIDLVYARANHPENIFGTAIYAPTARLWLHEDLARITLQAARKLYQTQGWILILKDGLRVTEAQAAMAETAIVKANPHWLQQPNRLLSPPGQGGHPRGMAVDVTARDAAGAAVAFGTAFDHLSPDPQDNPARRDYTDLPDESLANRVLLEQAFCEAAVALDLPLLPLPQEWWDFRLPPEIYNQYAPLSDADLPPEMRLCEITE